MREAVVTFRGKDFRGGLLYLHFYPHKLADDDGWIDRTVRRPQRVGLLIEGVATHFTIPSQVCEL